MIFMRVSRLHILYCEEICVAYKDALEVSQRLACHSKKKNP